MITSLEGRDAERAGRYHKVADNLEAKEVWVNGHTTLRKYRCC